MTWKVHEIGMEWIVSDSIVAASLVALSASSLLGMLEYPGTRWMKMDDEMDDMHCWMELVRGVYDESASHSDWLAVQMMMEVWTEFAFVEIQCKAASMAAISS